jgi:O-antigen ligase
MRAIGYRRLIVVILLLLGLIELLGGTVGTRVDQRGLVDIARFEIYKTQLDIIVNHAWFGIGLGGFESYFPSQRPMSIGSAGIIDRGHSTPLEIAVEMGLPVTALLGVLALIFLTLLAVAAVRTRRSDIIASLCVALLGLLHSCVDFSLQIPGYAVTYAALVATGLAHIGAARGRAQALPVEVTGKREAG